MKLLKSLTILLTATFLLLNAVAVSAQDSYSLPMGFSHLAGGQHSFTLGVQPLSTSASLYSGIISENGECVALLENAATSTARHTRGIGPRFLMERELRIMLRNESGIITPEKDYAKVYYEGEGEPLPSDALFKKGIAISGATSCDCDTVYVFPTIMTERSDSLLKSRFLKESDWSQEYPYCICLYLLNDKYCTAAKLFLTENGYCNRAGYIQNILSAIDFNAGRTPCLSNELAPIPGVYGFQRYKGEEFDIYDKDDIIRVQNEEMKRVAQAKGMTFDKDLEAPIAVATF